MKLGDLRKNLFKKIKLFKKKKPGVKPAEPLVEKAKPVKKVKPVEKLKPIEKVKPLAKKKVLGKAYKVLDSSHVTEKATNLEKENKYVFRVFPKANKIEIKQAIEETYGVDVEGVRIINIHRRRRRLGRQSGWKKGYKKAIVKIRKGQKIEILPR